MDQRRSSIVLILHGLITGWMCVAACICMFVEPSSGLRAASIVFTGSSIWMLVSWVWMGGRLLSAYFLFLLAALTFNGGQVWLFALDASSRMARNELLPDSLTRTVMLVTLSIVFLHLGALVALIRSKLANHLGSQMGRSSAKAIGWFLLAVSSGPAIMTTVSAIRAVAKYGYFAGVFQQEVPVGIDAAPILIGRLLMPAAFLIYAADSERKLTRRFVTLLVIVFAATHFFLGIRSVAVMVILGFAWLWERTSGQLSKRFLAISGCSLLVLLPVLAAIRDVPGSDRLSIESVLTILSTMDNPPAALLNETGDTIATVAHTMQLAPALIPYDMGASYYYAALTVVPNIFGGPLHPSFSHGSPGMWISAIIAPELTAMGGGLGYSFIAEAYINFGWPGIPLIMAALGAALQRFSQWADDEPTPQKLALVASAIGVLVFFARGESYGIVRPLVWYSVVPYLLVEMWSRRGRHALPILSVSKHSSTQAQQRPDCVHRDMGREGDIRPIP